MSQNSTQSLKPLTQSNYYTHETDWQYMSFSLYKDFCKCEAAALAKLKDDWKPKLRKSTKPDPLIFGNFIHSYFESNEAHEEYLQKKDVIKEVYKKGNPANGLKAAYDAKGLAEIMIKALSKDSYFRRAYLPGTKEIIVTGKIDGVLWKGKIDSLNLDEEYFCDLKTVDDIYKAHWTDGILIPRKTNFIFDRGYHLQMALYKEFIKQTFDVECEPLIFAVSKQDPPAKKAIDFVDKDSLDYMSFALDDLIGNQQHVLDVMHGEVKPKRCEKCEYCRQTAMLSGFTHASEIELG